MRHYARKTRSFKAGDIVFSKASDCDGLYIIDQGKVRVFKTLRVAGEEQQVELCQLGARAMFGEMAMFDEGPRSASVQAIEPTECTVIMRQIFDDQLAQIPSWMANLIRINTRRLRETNQR